MRFRTQIHNCGLLHKIVRSLSALAKICVIRLSKERVHFIVPGNEGRDGVQVWSNVKVGTLFSDFRIESNSDNEIWLELHLDPFLKVLRSADSSAGGSHDGVRGNATSLEESEVSLKLHKRDNTPIWAFEIKGKSPNGKPMTITHEINVRVLSQKRQQELTEPLCPSPDIHLVLPNLTELRNIVGRLSHVADGVLVSANAEGTMLLDVKAKGVDISTTWKDLQIPRTHDDDGEPKPAKETFFSTTVSIRGLLKFLTSHLVGGTAIACICRDHCIIAYVYIGEMSQAGGVLTFFIPAKNSGDIYD